MGQRVSSYSEEAGGVLTTNKKDLQEFKKEIALKKSIKDEKTDMDTSKIVENDFADATMSEMQEQQQEEKQQRHLESGDSPPIGSRAYVAQKIVETECAVVGANEKTDERKNVRDSSMRAIDSGICDLPKAGLPENLEQFGVHPSIAELSQLTALRMMRNFEELSRVDDLLHKQVNEELNEKLTDDNMSEKTLSIISYEDLPPVQLVENTGTLKRDSATYTNETKESMQDFETPVEESLPCKETGEESKSPEAETRTFECSASRGIYIGESSEEDDEEDENEAATNIFKDEGELEDKPKIEKSRDEKDIVEILHLRERLDKLECERNEARLRLRLFEERCKEYETDSRWLELTLSTMENKLRNIVTDLSDEVKKSQELEQQLSEAVRNTERILGGTATPVESSES